MSTPLNRRSLLLQAGSVLVSAGPLWAKTSQTGDRIMSKSNESSATAYIEAWSRKDLDGIAAHLHPAVHFKGPMQEVNGRDAVLAGAKRIFTILERMDIRGQFVSGDRAVFVYDFICRQPIGVCRTAELVRFEDGLVRDTELFFDARPFEAMQRAQAAGSTAK
jgi:SnoaL-like domain